MEDFEDAVLGLALTAVILASDSPASEALNVPGEPRVVGGVILNCLRFPYEDDNAAFIPSLEEAVCGVKEAMEWPDISVEKDCHFVNIHDLNGNWRIDAAFHYVVGTDPAGSDFPLTIGIAGLVVLDTSKIPDEYEAEALAAVKQVEVSLQNAFHANDLDDKNPHWKNIQSTLFH